MVFCIILGCSTRSCRDKEFSFFRVPAVVKNRGELEEELSIERRRRWISAISREHLTDKILDSQRVCSRHFVSGKAASLWDRHNIDWVPSLNLGHSKTSPNTSSAEATKARADRVKERRKRSLGLKAKEVASKVRKINDPGLTVSNINFGTADFSETFDEIDQSLSTASEQEIDFEPPSINTDDLSSALKDLKLIEKASQTEEFDYLFQQKQPECFSERYFTEYRDCDERVRFYTGLPCFSVLKKTFNHVSPHVTYKSKRLTQFQEFVLVLIRLRLNVFMQDLAYRFDISRRTVNRIFNAWMIIMDGRLSPLIYWPDRESLHSTMPQCFQYSFGKRTTVIIDCYEVFINKPSNYLARAQTFSNYKHHNTIKVLIGITPQGTISFVSQAWGGRTSDKFLTENCALLQKLVPGDMVMADRGFTISESVGLRQARLVIPAFTKGKAQLSPYDVEKTRGIAAVRIHVERVIGLLRRKYTILQGILPIDLLQKSGKEQVPVIDRIIRVCSALVNLCPPIVPFE